MKLFSVFIEKTIDFFQPLAYSPNMSNTNRLTTTVTEEIFLSIASPEEARREESDAQDLRYYLDYCEECDWVDYLSP